MATTATTIMAITTTTTACSEPSALPEPSCRLLYDSPHLTYKSVIPSIFILCTSHYCNLAHKQVCLRSKEGAADCLHHSRVGWRTVGPAAAASMVNQNECDAQGRLEYMAATAG